jgi:hypothetical protein
MSRAVHIRLVMLFSVVFVLSGCAATVPVMPDQFDVEAEKFSPKSGKANIYVVRENVFEGSAIVFQVLLNGKVQGAIAPGTYFLFEVSPGSHAVAVITQESADSEKFEAVAGKNYFIEIKPKVGWVAARASVDKIDDDRGRKLVIDGKRAELVITD